MILRKEILEMTIADKKMRDALSHWTHVLASIKRVETLPGTNWVSMEQVARYYDIDVKEIKKVYGAHKAEIEEDGTALLPRNFYIGSGLNVTTIKQSGSIKYQFDDGMEVIINNRGIKVFSVKAMLRIGMLLPGSEIAARVRKELLQIFVEENCKEIA